jgi:hypothetical protein
MATVGTNAEAKFDEIVSFPEWRESLQRAPELAAGTKLAYERAILGGLRACKAWGRPLSAGFIRWQLARAGLTETSMQAERAGLAWLFLAARAAGKTRRVEGAFVPPAADEAGEARGPANAQRSTSSPPRFRHGDSNIQRLESRFPSEVEGSSGEQRPALNVQRPKIHFPSGVEGTCF